MKLVNFHRRPISMVALVTFAILLCFWANQSPASTTVPAPEKSSASAMENGEADSTNFVEMENNEPLAKKGKKFPWLVVGAVVVVGALAVYFLVLNKKYALTVSLTGAAGTPAATKKYRKNAAVAYNYTPQAGYVNLEVKLDGVTVPAAGTVTMDKEHTLTVTAVQGSMIQVNSTPAGAAIYLDDADSGFTTPHGFQYATGVTQTVLVRMCGYGDYAKKVSANIGQTATVDANLSAGIHEDFDAPASSCWTPLKASSWSTGGGVYKHNANVPFWEYSYYDHAFSSDYTLTAKMRRVQGGTPRVSYPTGLFLCTSNGLTSTSGYAFQYAPDGYWTIWMEKNSNLATGAGTWSFIRSWTKSAAISRGLGAWNTLKVVKAGNNYSFYINDVHLYSFTNATNDPKYAVLYFGGNKLNVIVEFAYVYLTPGAGSDSIPGLPASPFTSADDNRQAHSEM